MDTELIKLIINPNVSNQTCFLCFKQYDELLSIHSDLVILKSDEEFTVSVFKMVSCLFSLQETVLQQVCDKCSKIVISIYILIQQHNVMKQNVIKIIQKLDEEASRRKKSNKKCLKLHITHDDGKTRDKAPCNIEVIGTEVVECLKCNMNFESKDKLKEHKKIAHMNTNAAVICYICGKNCKVPSSLKSHLNCHQEKQCPYCSKILKTHSHYKIHVQNHVTASKRKRNQTSYKCHNCNFVSFSKGSLEAHINKVHLGVRPHICPLCSKGFFKKSNLTEHISIHDKVKTETCEVCGDHFVSKKTLMEHLRLHENQKPYKCDVCSKSFVTSGRRSDHVKRKHLQKTECCLICNKMFSLKKELNRHAKKCHWQSLPEFSENINNSENEEMLMAITG